MRETELRIGNLINLYRKPEDKEMTQHKVKAIFTDNIQGHEEYFIEIEDGFVVNITSGIEAIPLTRESILKFGYREPKDNNYKGMFIINGHRIWTCNDLFMCDKNGVVIKYVHQLQNLYRALTNCDLTINQLEEKQN